MSGHATRTLPWPERFWAKVEGGDYTTCWEWQAALTKGAGYGIIKDPSSGGSMRQAHRVAYELLVGEIPEGLQLDHLCRNRACVNPWHLEPVTPQVNVRRGESVGARALRRTHCLNGHDYSTHGVVRQGRRICRTCLIGYLRAYRQRRREERQQQWIAKERAA